MKTASAWNSTKPAFNANARRHCPRSTRILRINSAFRADIIVAQEVIVELKSVEHLAPVHEVQLLTYLKMSGYHVGRLMNFNTLRLKDGLRRFVV